MVRVKIDKALFLLALKGAPGAVGEVRRFIAICARATLNRQHLLNAPARYIGYAGNNCGDVVEDIVQDCFTDLFENKIFWVERLSGAEEVLVEPYLSRTVTNFIIDRQRAQRLEEIIKDENELMAHAGEEGKKVDDDVNYEDLVKAITKAIDAEPIGDHRKDRIKRMTRWLAEEKNRVTKPIISDFCKLEDISDATASADIALLRDMTRKIIGRKNK